MFHARADVQLQQLIRTMRQPTLSAENVNWILECLQTRCTLVTDRASVPEHATWLLPTHAAVHAARQERYDNATAEKTIFQSEDTVQRGITWPQTRDARHAHLLNKNSGLAESVLAIVGDRMAVTLNTTLPHGTLIPNGTIGVVEKLDTDTITLRLPNGSLVGFPRSTSHVVFGYGNLQLKRKQFPLVLACVFTIHASQGGTEMAIATYVDNTWQNQLWSRDMLFTLLTRVQRLSDIYLVGSFNHSSLALLLSQQSWWY